ncbi:MAG: hypothetical protein AAGA96_12285, partial [Verrucomicrobiota bacterium]
MTSSPPQLPLRLGIYRNLSKGWHLLIAASLLLTSVEVGSQGVPNNTNVAGMPLTAWLDSQGLNLINGTPETLVGLFTSAGEPITDPIQVREGYDGDFDRMEKYIDGFDHRLHMAYWDLGSIADGENIANPNPVIRRYRPFTYNSKAGLLPGEDPSQVMGGLWTNSVTPTIRFEIPVTGPEPTPHPETPPTTDTSSDAYQTWVLEGVRKRIERNEWEDAQNRPYRAIVTDEKGDTHVFLLDREMRWVPLLSRDRLGEGPRSIALSLAAGKYVFTSGSGSIEFEYAPGYRFIPLNRWQNPGAVEVHAAVDNSTDWQWLNDDESGTYYRWARATAVQTTKPLQYTYVDDGTRSPFIPSSVTDTNGNDVFTIVPDATNSNLIGSITDSLGHIVTYTYQSQNHVSRHGPQVDVWLLTDVDAHDLTIAPADPVLSDSQFTYALTVEESLDPVKPPIDPSEWSVDATQWIDLSNPDQSPVEHYHWNMVNWVDPLVTHEHTYVVDHSLVSYHNDPFWEGEYVITGKPMLVSGVTQYDTAAPTVPTGQATFLADWYFSLFSIDNLIGNQQNGWRVSTVTDQNGVSRRLAFNQLELVRLDTMRGAFSSLRSMPVVAKYHTITLTNLSTEVDEQTYLPNVSDHLSRFEESFSSFDTDGDGYSDLVESYFPNSNPNSASSTPYPNPFQSGNDHLLGDPYYGDRDNDNFSDAFELAFYGTSPDIAADNPGAGQPYTGSPNEEPDSDGDGIPDAWEIQYGLDASDPRDAERDDDYDRISNLQEYRDGTVPTVDWTLYSVESSGILQTLNERGQFVRVVEDTVNQEFTAERKTLDGEWTAVGGLRTSVGGTTLPFLPSDTLVAQNNWGEVAAIFVQEDSATGTTIQFELRVLDRNGTVLNSGIIAGTSPEIIRMTDTGYVMGSFLGNDGFQRAFVWSGGTLTIHAVTGEDVFLVGGNELGQLLANASETVSDNSGKFWDGNTWQALGAHALALNQHGEVVLSQATIGTGSTFSYEAFLWNSDSGLTALGIVFDGNELALINDRDQFVIHGPFGYPPIIYDPELGIISLVAPAESRFISPWIQPLVLNDLGELGGSFFNSVVSDPNDPKRQGFSWADGDYIFTGIYDESTVTRITNSGFMGLGASSLVSQEVDADGDGIIDNPGAPDVLQPQFGVVVPMNDLDENRLPDDWESFYGVADPNEDHDDDGLPNWAEYVYLTDPKEVDTDGDGIMDGNEVSQGLDPSWPGDGVLTSDVDGDGLTLQEELSLGTDPSLADTDADGHIDGWEVMSGTNPLDVNDIPSEVQWVDVLWTDLVGTDGSVLSGVGGTLTKTAITTSDDADAVSVRWLEADGAVRFGFDDDTSVRVIGLNDVNASTQRSDLDYAIQVSGVIVSVYEKGIYRIAIGHIDPSDIYKIAREGTEVNYYKNDLLVYTSTIPSSGDLVVDTSMSTPGSTISRVRYQGFVNETELRSRDNDGDLIPNGWELDHGLNPNLGSDGVIDTDEDGWNNYDEYAEGTDPNDAADARLEQPYEDVVWTNLVGTDGSVLPGLGGTLTKVATTTSDDADAVSLKSLQGDGAIRFGFEDDSSVRVIGLNDVNAGRNRPDLNYSIQ